MWTPLKYHPVQARLWSSSARFKVVPAGRRCLIEGTLVATPIGPTPIEKLKPGDEVIGYNSCGEPETTTVSDLWINGDQEVIPLITSNRMVLAATEDHQLWGCNESEFDKRREHLIKGFDRIKVKDVSPRHRIAKAYCFELMRGGSKSIPLTYALGVLMGDGCSRENKSVTGKRTRNLYLSSEDTIIPDYLSSLLNCAWEKNRGNNYTYKLNVGDSAIEKIPFYKEWVHNRYSHEKIADWSEVNTWDKESSLSFLAGIIDTDGSIFYKNYDRTEAVLKISMQAETVVQVCSNIIFKYFQEKLLFTVDDRPKYKNGPVYEIRTTSNFQLIHILKYLDKYLIKKRNFDISCLNVRNILPDRIGFKKGESFLAPTYDITVDNETNLYVLHDNGIVTSNSGKTELAKRKIICSALKGTPFSSARFFCAAPTREQAKRIFWQDLKRYSPKEVIRDINETELSITYTNDSTILVLGMDRPERIEGPPWDGGVLDEYANMHERVWPEHVRAALSDRLGWCWFIGVPEGKNHYYDLYYKAIKGDDPLWEAFTWYSSDILPPEEIEAAKRDLDELTFSQEYCADFISFEGQIYYAFSKANIRPQQYDAEADLLLCFDFNIQPGVAAIVQEDQEYNNRGERIQGGTNTYIIDEVFIPKASNTLRVCQQILNKYEKHKGDVYVYGDSTGGAGGTGRVMGSDWDLVEQALEPVFRDRYFMEVPRSNPKERHRINAVNSRIKSLSGRRRLFVDPKCENVVRDFEGVRSLPDGSIDKKKDPKLTHMCFAAGTKVNTDRGLLLIENIPTTGKIEICNGFYVDYVNPGMRGMKDTVELIFSDNSRVVCTKDHLFLTAEGWKSAVELLDIPLYNILFHRDQETIKKIMIRKELADIVVNYSRSTSISKQNEKIVPKLATIKVERIIERPQQPVYCPTVDTGCFLLNNEIIVSNSDAIGYMIHREYPVISYQGGTICIEGT